MPDYKVGDLIWHQLSMWDRIPDGIVNKHTRIETMGGNSEICTFIKKRCFWANGSHTKWENVPIGDPDAETEPNAR
jgi:hypothetical protein